MAAKRSSVVRGRVGVTMSPGRTRFVVGASGESAVLGSNTSPEIERGCVKTGTSSKHTHKRIKTCIHARSVISPGKGKHGCPHACPPHTHTKTNSNSGTSNTHTHTNTEITHKVAVSYPAAAAYEMEGCLEVALVCSPYILSLLSKSISPLVQRLSSSSLAHVSTRSA